MDLLEWLNSQSIKYHVTFGILLTLVIGYFDYLTGFELRMEVFYLVPISYVTWFIGEKTGIVFSAVSLITILCSDVLSGKKFNHFTIELWNMAMYFVFFVTVTLLLKLQKTLKQRESLITELESALSEIDELSGLLPICANCKKVRDDEGYRQEVAAYISKHAKAGLSSGLCRECATKLYPRENKKEKSC